MAVRLPTSLLAIAISSLSTLSAQADHNIACEPKAPGSSQSTPPDQVVISDINIQSNDIFEEDDEAIWLHKLANDLHINSKPHVIKSLLSFEQGDTVNLDDIQESERLLRQLDYIRDATVQLDTDCNHNPNGRILVNTWDHWTLYPRLNYSSSGGETKYSYGIKDDNLLGLGIQGNFKYFADADRKGYGVKVDAPTTFVAHSSLSLAAFDNDDGYRYGLGWSKPFYTLKTTDSYYFNSEHSKQDLHIDQNGEDENIFTAQKKFFEAGYGWSEGKQDNWTQRWSVGVTANEEDFSPSDDINETSLAIPDNRRFIYPWLQYQILEDDYEVISDVHFIHEKEDHHLGWRHSIRMGVEADHDENDRDIAGHIKTSSAKGVLMGKHLWLGSLNSTADLGTAATDYYKVSTGFEYFYNWSPANKFYFKSEYTFSGNNYIDQPITLGGDIDDNDNEFEYDSTTQPTVRGYPAQYQHGNKRWQSTLEIRHYPGIEIYRLARMAWVGFIDGGRAWGDENIISQNEQDSTLVSIGFGIRLAAIRSSGRNVIHIDFAKTLTSGENVDSWAISAHAKKNF